MLLLAGLAEFSLDGLKPTPVGIVLGVIGLWFVVLDWLYGRRLADWNAPPAIGWACAFLIYTLVAVTLIIAAGFVWFKGAFAADGKPDLPQFLISFDSVPLLWIVSAASPTLVFGIVPAIPAPTATASGPARRDGEKADRLARTR